MNSSGEQRLLKEDVWESMNKSGHEDTHCPVPRVYEVMIDVQEMKGFGSGLFKFDGLLLMGAN